MPVLQIRISLLLAGLFACGTLNAQSPPCDYRAQAVAELGQWASDSLIISNRPRRYPVNDLVNFDTDYVRFLIDAAQVSGGWSLAVRDHEYRPLLMLNNESVATEVFWTGRLAGNDFIFEFAPQVAGDKISINGVMALRAETERPLQHSWSGATPNFQDLYEGSDHTTDHKKLGDRVGMLTSAASGGLAWCCSGVFLSADLFLTNWHCGGPEITDAELWQGNACPATIVDPAWQSGPNRMRRERSCDSVVAKSRALDYALLRIKPTVGAIDDAVDTSPLPIANGVQAQQDLLLVHHSQCRYKQLSASNCRVLDPSWPGWFEPGDTEFTHACHTAAGGSGAPVFNLGGELVGLHHLGYEKQQDGSCDNRNKAVHICEILADISASAPELSIPVCPA